VRALLLVIPAVAACAEPLPDEPPPEAYCATPRDEIGELRPFAEQAFVAHAGGSPYGLMQEEPYSNTREAFEISYANGYRAFEFDLIRLADGDVVAAHSYSEDEYGLPDGTFPTMTRAELAGARFRGKYEILFADDVIELVVEHPDIWLVLDTKLDFHTEIVEHVLALAPDDSVRDRLVPHLANQDEIDRLAEDYPLPERLYAHYKWNATDAQLVERMERNGLDDVMMSHANRWTEETQDLMDSRGWHVWVHSPHEIEDIRRFRDRGVGVYTDGWIECN
jgi:glycerophosphoryl diester phosphodiesterase